MHETPMFHSKFTATGGATPLAQVIAYIDQNACEPLRLEQLASIACLSVFRFATVFRQQFGVPPHRYICRLRVERAKALVREGVPLARVASEAGFYDQSHLSRHFKSLCGMTPGQYLAQLRGEPEAGLERAT